MFFAHWLALRSRSQHIVAAVRVLGCGWIASLSWYWLVSSTGQTWGYAVINFMLAVAFWRMSCGQWFPAPLFFVHAAQVVNYGVMTVFSLNMWWQIVFANRIFEIAIAYIVACALFRISQQVKKSAG